MAAKKGAKKAATVAAGMSLGVTKALTIGEIKTATKGLKPKVHMHPLPRCSGDTHNGGCEGKGLELSCNQVTVLGKKFAVCTHLG